MTPAAGPYLAGCVLLVAAGAAKLRRPAATASALAAVGVGAPRWAVRAGGAAELALGAVALASESAPAAAVVACSYGLFAAFVAASLVAGRRGAGCGCFGDTAAPVHAVQAGVDLAVAAAAVAVAAEGGLAAPPLARSGLVLVGGAVAWVTYLVLVPLPRLLGAVREATR